MSGEGMIPSDSAWQAGDRTPQRSRKSITCICGPLDGCSFEVPDGAIGFNLTMARRSGEYREQPGSAPRRFEWVEGKGL